MIFCLCALLILVFLFLEKYYLEKNRRTVPLRIHVYGTRGKTGLTRLIVAMLQANGLKVLGRTTGDEPIIINPEGTPQKQRRWGQANVHEYFGLLSKASALHCDAIVVECMALSPESVSTAKKILAPTHVLLTNTRPDHYESQGETAEDIVRTLALSIGQKQQIYAVRDEGSHIVADRAAKFGNPVTLLDTGDTSPARQAANLTACLAREIKLPFHARPAGEWPKFAAKTVRGISFLWLDLFSANDILSTRQSLAKAGQGLRTPLVALFATRPDRPLRTKTFIDWFAAEAPFSFYALTGWHAWYARPAMAKRDLNILPGGPFQNGAGLLKAIRSAAGGEFALVGLGNAHGYGEKFRAFLGAN